MAIPSIAVNPPFAPFVSATPDIRGVQEALALAAEQNLIGTDIATVTFADSVDLSQTSRLLSSVADIADAANAAETGNAVDSAAVVEDVQRFVDSVNALNFDGQLTAFALGTVLDINVETLATIAPAVLPPEPEAPGIDVVPVAGPGATFVLTLDSQELQNALETDATAATSQLAAFAVPLGNAVVQAEINEQLAGGLGPLAFGTETLLATTGQTAAEVPPVVPDLTVENAVLRQALADTALADILDAVAAGAANLPVQNLVAETVTPPLVSNEPNDLPTTSDAFPTNEVAAALPPENGALLATPVVTAGAGDNTASLVAAQATLQTETTMTLAALVTTPLEQIAQLAANPTVAGAVAAFQIPVDDSGRAARISLASDFDLVNPAAGVPQTGAIGPNLANSGEQRRDNAGDTLLNRWWATRPGLT